MHNIDCRWVDEAVEGITLGDQRMFCKPSPVVNEIAHHRNPGDDELVKHSPDDKEPSGSPNLQIQRPHRGDGGRVEHRRRWIEGRRISLP